MNTSKVGKLSLTLLSALSVVGGGGNYLPMGHCVRNENEDQDPITDKDRAAIAKAKERQLRRQLRRDAQRALN